jgi:hypothetical protein
LETPPSALLEKPAGAGLSADLCVGSDEIGAPADKLPLTARVWIVIGLAIALWAILIGLLALIS